MKHESEYASYLIPRFLRMAEFGGFHVTPETRILDFGCGDGAFVYLWRDAGFDAYGFDLHDSLKLRSGEDRGRFRINQLHSPNPVDFRVRAQDFRIDFDDGFFDLVISNQVLEHAQDHDLVFRELSRVMNRRSIGFHIFPGAYRLVEPHTQVPLATFIQARWWFALWARLGIRNEFQHGKGAGEVADMNHAYVRTGINYRRPADVIRSARACFEVAAYTPQFWEFPGRKSPYLFGSSWVRAAYTCTHMSVLMTAKSG